MTEEQYRNLTKLQKERLEQFLRNRGLGPALVPFVDWRAFRFGKSSFGGGGCDCKDCTYWWEKCSGVWDIVK